MDCPLGTGSAVPTKCFRKYRCQEYVSEAWFGVIGNAWKHGFKLVQNHGIHGYDSWYGSGVSIGAWFEAMQHACGRKLCICHSLKHWNGKCEKWEILTSLQNPHKSLTVTRTVTFYTRRFNQMSQTDQMNKRQLPSSSDPLSHLFFFQAQWKSMRIQKPTSTPQSGTTASPLSFNIHPSSAAKQSLRFITFTVHRSDRSLPFSFGSLAASSFPTCTANALMSKNNNVVTRFIEYWTQSKTSSSQNKVHLENVIFAKKQFSFAELSRTPCLSFAVHAGQELEEKHGCVMWCVISSNCSRRLIPCHTSFCGSCTQTFIYIHYILL